VKPLNNARMIAELIFFLGIAILIFGGAPSNIAALIFGTILVVAAFIMQHK
jgi:hypothetical protein